MKGIAQFLRDYGVLLAFIVQGFWFVVAWWFSKSVATKDDMSAFGKKVDGVVEATLEKIDDVAERVARLEQRREDAPSSHDIVRLRLEMERARGDMNTFGSKLEGAERLVTSQINGLMVLVKRAEDMCAMLTEHLLRGGK